MTRSTAMTLLSYFGKFGGFVSVYLLVSVRQAGLLMGAMKLRVAAAPPHAIS